MRYPFLSLKPMVNIPMAKLSSGFSSFDKPYLFSEVSAKKALYPPEKIIDLSIGDVRFPIEPSVAQEIAHAAHEMSRKEGIKGYGPSTGYDFLKEQILSTCYQGYSFQPEEVIISSGICPDLAFLDTLFPEKTRYLVVDPSYPLYKDLAQMSNKELILVSATEENAFKPLPPKDQKADVIFLCSPHNPTGVCYTKDELALWVQYAKQCNALIFFDGAYLEFCQDAPYVQSIYDVEGAKDVAIELKSFSKAFGFTGLRLSYFLIPKQLLIETTMGVKPLLPFVYTLYDTKSNGVSYPIQMGGMAALSEQGLLYQKQCIQSYQFYITQMKQLFQSKGLACYGGNAPFLWVKAPVAFDDLEFFNHLLHEHHIACIPGSGFGPCGKNFVRFSGFIDETTFEKFQQQLQHFEVFSAL